MRSMMGILVLAAVAAVPGGASAREMTVEDVIARHVTARGGAEAWKKIRTLRLTGQMTSWSRKSPFTLERTADGKYHLDSTQQDKKVEIGYDGQTAWWDNHMMQPGPQRMRGADLAVLMREIDYPTPFFDYLEKKHEVKLAGRTKFEGQDAIAIELKRADGLSETWYLDPATFLDIARESPGSDFGNPVPQRTYHDDFRVVEGVKMPFRVESQWYTRERIFEVEKAEANIALDDSRFRMPPPTGMEMFVGLEGDWKVAVSHSPGPGAPFQDSERTSRIEKLLGGALMQERFTGTRGSQVVRQISFDRFRKRYRVTEIDDTYGLVDVLEGEFGEDKRLVLTNLNTGTPTLAFGFTIHGRLTILDVTDGGFRVEEEYSVDGGKEWTMSQKAVYTRVAK